MNRVGIEPALLQWACERSGRGAEDLLRRFPKLESWKRGEIQPTLKQLESFANAVRTPIGYLFLEEPPVEKLPVTDFRTVGDVAVGRPSPDLLDTLYLCQRRQDWYRDEALSVGNPPLQFVGSLTAADDVISSAARLRYTLGFDVEQRGQVPTWSEALRQFIEQADTLGILVMVSGVVGNNTHRRLDPEEFRGFALSDTLAPLVFINGADTKAAQMFTLAHEIAHLALGESGVSSAQASAVPDHSVERWCNQTAAELLVPAESIREAFNPAHGLSAEMSRLAKRFKVSTLVVLRRIYDVGELTRNEFWSLYQEETNRLRKIRVSTGGNYHRNVTARVGRRFARALIASALEGRTPFVESLRLLDIKKMSAFKEIARNLGVGS